MNRNEQLELLRANLKNKNLFKHCLATEAVMRALARRFDENEEVWATAGLLHDIDYDETAQTPERHGNIGADMLAGSGFSDEIVAAVRAHNPAAGAQRVGLMDKALAAVDPLTGLIVAAALIRPEKKLQIVDTQFVLNRFGEKLFAKGATREELRKCEEFGLSLEEFVTISLDAMKSISGELDL
jgi:putative nucleotidyltransferase with HDIG domain